ncbi:MAG: hypothetical protein WCC53_16350 [Thermoanaerobaculia bacterium]
MKALLLPIAVLAAALLDAAFHFIAALLGIGPWSHSITVVNSSMAGTGEETTIAWLRLGADALSYEQYLVWPLVLLLVCSVYMRIARTAPWWHGVVIALAAAPLMLAARGITGALFVCAYAVLLSVFCLLAFRRRLAA